MTFDYFKKSRVSLLSVIAIAGMTLSGCAESEAPTSALGKTSSLSSKQSSVQVARPPVEQEESPLSLADVQPCTLLTVDNRSAMGILALGTPSTRGIAKLCDWVVPNTFGLTVTLDTQSGLAEVIATQENSSPGSMGNHETVTISDQRAKDGTCAVVLGAGDSSSVHVDVSNTNFRDTRLACQRALDVAKLIEPKLP